MFSALFSILTAAAVIYTGWWLASLNGWFEWGVGVMAIGLLTFIGRIFTFLNSAFQASQQINFLHESRAISHSHGHARLANEEDKFVKELTKNRSGFYIGTLGKPLFYDPFASGNGHMLTYAPSRTGKTFCQHCCTGLVAACL